MFYLIRWVSVFCISLIFYSLTDAQAGNNALLIGYKNAIQTQECEKAEEILLQIKENFPDNIYLRRKAEAYELGYCVDADYEKALKLYEQIYDIAQTQAMMNIGTIYLNNKKDIESAQKWFRTFALTFAPSKKENKRRLEDIEVIKDVFKEAFEGKRTYPEDEFNQAIQWATSLIQGKPEDIFKYYQVFSEGSDGYPVNQNVARRLLIESAIEREYPQAAWVFANQQLKKAENDWRYLRSSTVYLKIAALGNIQEAQVELARTFLKLEKYRLAYEWFVFARKNGASVDSEINGLEKRLEPSLAKFYRKRIEEGKTP